VTGAASELEHRTHGPRLTSVATEVLAELLQSEHQDMHAAICAGFVCAMMDASGARHKRSPSAF
jgi:hypothetical protein